MHLLTERLRREPELATPLADVIAHRRPGDHDTVLLREAISDPLRRVPLLTRRRLIGDQDLIDPLPPRAQRRRGPTHRPLALRRNRRPQRLADRPPMHPVPARQRVRRQPVELAIPPDLLEQLHSRHPFCDLRSALQRTRTLRSRSDGRWGQIKPSHWGQLRPANSSAVREGGAKRR